MMLLREWDAMGSSPTKGFVQDHQLRLVDEGGDEGQLLLHAWEYALMGWARSAVSSNRSAYRRIRS
jgi:hypothetical protein